VPLPDAAGRCKAGQEQPAAAADVEDIAASRDELDAARDGRDAVAMMLQHALEKRSFGEHAAADRTDVACGITIAIAWGLRVRAAGR
jgi:hypothetical protein